MPAVYRNPRYERRLFDLEARAAADAANIADMCMALNEMSRQIAHLANFIMRQQDVLPGEIPLDEKRPH